MAVPFPSVEFFETLKERFGDDAVVDAKLDPSEAYCGLAIGDGLYVLEFDGSECAAVVYGGNPLDLDFVLAASTEVWGAAVSGIGDPDQRLEELVGRGEIEIHSEQPDGSEQARRELGFLQAFLDQARGLEVNFG